MVINRWITSLLCCCLLATSCTTLRDVPLPGGTAPVSGTGIKPGDDVVVTLRDGSSLELKVVQIDAAALTGRSGRSAESSRYAFADMRALEVRRVSFWKTSGAVGAGLLVVAGAVFVALIHAIAENDE